MDSVQTRLDDAVSERSRTPAHLKDQIEDKDNQITELQNALFSLELKIRNQEEELRQKNIRICQQQQTIQIHSEEIAKSHTRFKKFESTPIRYPSQQGLANRFQNQIPPPSYDQVGQPAIATVPHYRTKWGDVPQDQHCQDPYRVNSRGHDVFNSCNISASHSPEYTSQRFMDATGSPIPHKRARNLNLANGQDTAPGSAFTTPPKTAPTTDNIRDVRLTPTTSHGSGQIPIPPVPPQTPDRSDSVVSKPRSTKDGAITPFGSSNSKQARLSKVFSDLFDHAVEFAYYYANIPSTQADSHLPQALKKRLLGAATQSTAHKIMSSQNTRYLLVAKVIILWIEDKIFKRGTFPGLIKDIDHTITETQKKIFKDTPPAVRFVFLRDITNQFIELKKAPNYEDFLCSTSHKRAVELWNVIRPLLYNKVDGDWQNMHNLITEAHRVAETQFVEIVEFKLFFPKLGDPFNDASMINMDPEFDDLTADELMGRRVQVRLGAIPQVMARITGADGSIMTKTLVKAGVLLKWPDQKK